MIQNLIFGLCVKLLIWYPTKSKMAAAVILKFTFSAIIRPLCVASRGNKMQLKLKWIQFMNLVLKRIEKQPSCSFYV